MTTSPDPIALAREWLAWTEWFESKNRDDGAEPETPLCDANIRGEASDHFARAVLELAAERDEAHVSLDTLDVPRTIQNDDGETRLSLAMRIEDNDEEVTGLLLEARAERDGWFAEYERVTAERDALKAALVECCDLADRLSNYVTKFPATGGPTMTDKRIAELRRIAEGGGG